MEYNKPKNHEPQTAEEAMRMLDEIEAEIQQGIGADYYETIQKGKDSINHYEQTTSLPSNKNNAVNIESRNREPGTEKKGHQFPETAMQQNAQLKIKKPSLADYNLTQEMYDNEVRKYKEEKEIKRREYDKKESSKFRITFLSILILIIIIGVAILPNTSGYILIFFSPIFSIMLFLFFSSNKTDNYNYIDETNESDIIQRYNKYSSDLKVYEAEVAKFNKKIQMLKEKYWIDMSGHRFEKEIAALFRMSGYYSMATRGSHDGGVDIILNKDNITYYVQCKNHIHPVGPATARDLLGTMSHDGVKNGILVSPMGFTKGVYDFVKGKNIKLLKIEGILEMVDKIK